MQEITFSLPIRAPRSQIAAIEAAAAVLSEATGAKLTVTEALDPEIAAMLDATIAAALRPDGMDEPS